LAHRPFDVEYPEPASLRGLHNSGKCIIVICDQASEIDDVIWDVTQGALTDANTEIIWLVLTLQSITASSPGSAWTLQVNDGPKSVHGGAITHVLGATPFAVPAIGTVVQWLKPLPFDSGCRSCWQAPQRAK